MAENTLAKRYLVKGREDTPYNYCKYAFLGHCCTNDHPRCILSKCYHDMTGSELRRFQFIWRRASPFIDLRGERE